MKRLVCFLFCLLLIATNEALPHNSAVEKKENYSFKKGLIVNHWVGVLHEGMQYGNPAWFSRKDVSWIADRGFDHVQFYLSGSAIVNTDNILNVEKLAILDSAIHWCKTRKLGVIISLADFPDFKIDSTLSDYEKNMISLRRQSEFWEPLAGYFKSYGPILRFIVHVDISQLTKDAGYLNSYNLKSLTQIRKINPQRHVYLPCLNLKNLDNLELPKRDKHFSIAFAYDDLLGYTFQHIKPFIFPDSLPVVTFPGIAPDFEKVVAVNNPMRRYLEDALSNQPLNKETIRSAFKILKSYRKKPGNDIDFYLLSWGYFLYHGRHPETLADRQSISNYANAMVDVCRNFEIHWSIYDYNSGMAVKNEKGEATPILTSIKSKMGK